MEQKLWQEKIICRLRAALGEDYQVQLLPDLKKKECFAVGIRKDGERNGIQVPLPLPQGNGEGNGAELQTAAAQILKEYGLLHSELEGEPLEGLERENARKHIVFILTHSLKKEQTGKLIMQPYFHMSKILAIHWTSKDREYGRTIVPQDLEYWNMTPEQAFQEAESNTPRIHPPVLLEFSQWAFGSPNAWNETFRNSLEKLQERRRNMKRPLFVLTSADGTNGAACILYPGVLENIAERMEDNLLLLIPNPREAYVIPGNTVMENWTADALVRAWRLRDAEEGDMAQQLLWYDHHKKEVSTYGQIF